MGKKWESLAVAALVSSSLSANGVEANNNVGGLSKSIVKGRFEFNNILHSLFFKNKTTDRFRIDNLLTKYKIEDELRFSPLPEVCRI